MLDFLKRLFGFGPKPEVKVEEPVVEVKEEAPAKPKAKAKRKPRARKAPAKGAKKEK